MRPIEHIRRRIFGVSQAELGGIAGTTQASVSRWERGELSPDQTEMERIRSEARARGFEWDDAWFFEVPEPITPPPAEASAA